MPRFPVLDDALGRVVVGRVTSGRRVGDGAVAGRAAHTAVLVLVVLPVGAEEALVDLAVAVVVFVVAQLRRRGPDIGSKGGVTF